MKLKHIISLVLLIIISGTIFYFGWIQIELAENTYGIAFTKSNGYIKHIYEPGKFSWNYRKIIPGNFNLLKFNLYSQILEINEQGQLPSGNIYSDYLPGKPDFSYQFKYFLSYAIKLESFPEIVANLSLKPDQIPNIYNKYNADIQLYISEYYKNKATENNSTSNIFYNNKELSEQVLSSLSKRFPFLEFFDFIPSSIIIPDAVLYNKAKEIYLSGIQLQNKVISETKLKVAEQEIIDNANFETLKKYGELLNEYPSLIDLFSVIDFNSASILPIPVLDIQKEKLE
jgi:hypothetical protein